MSEDYMLHGFCNNVIKFITLKCNIYNFHATKQFQNVK